MTMSTTLKSLLKLRKKDITDEKIKQIWSLRKNFGKDIKEIAKEVFGDEKEYQTVYRVIKKIEKLISEGVLDENLVISPSTLKLEETKEEVEKTVKKKIPSAEKVFQQVYKEEVVEKVKEETAKRLLLAHDVVKEIEELAKKKKVSEVDLIYEMVDFYKNYYNKVKELEKKIQVYELLISKLLKLLKPFTQAKFFVNTTLEKAKEILLVNPNANVKALTDLAREIIQNSITEALNSNEKYKQNIKDLHL